MTDPRYPDISVQLVGEDGNAFAIIARVRKALQQAGVPDDEVKQFTEEATASGSYDALLRVVMSWVDVT